MSTRHGLPGLLWLGAMSLVAGCVSLKKEVVTPYDLMIEVSPRVNLDEAGRPAPILLAIYEMKSEEKFSDSGYTDLQEGAKSVLGDELVSAEQMILRPGERRFMRRPGNPDAHLLGVVAGYREQGHRRWKCTFVLPGPKGKYWQFASGRISLRVAVKPDGIAVSRVK